MTDQDKRIAELRLELEKVKLEHKALEALERKHKRESLGRYGSDELISGDFPALLRHDMCA